MASSHRLRDPAIGLPCAKWEIGIDSVKLVGGASAAFSLLGEQASLRGFSKGV